MQDAWSSVCSVSVSVSVQRFDFAVCNCWALLFSEEATLNLVTLQTGSSPPVFCILHDQDLVCFRDEVMIQFSTDTFSVNFCYDPEAFG